MAFCELLADRVRKLLSRRKGFSEKKMFGGMCFLLDGNMCCGVVEDKLVLRLSVEAAARALESAHTTPMDFTGRPMKNFVYVLPPGYAPDEALGEWVRLAAGHAASLPPKEKPPKHQGA
jgi:TfoX/Sxy family transcriptional regulator of competence genes